MQNYSINIFFSKLISIVELKHGLEVASKKNYVINFHDVTEQFPVRIDRVRVNYFFITKAGIDHKLEFPVQFFCDDKGSIDFINITISKSAYINYYEDNKVNVNNEIINLFSAIKYVQIIAIDVEPFVKSLDEKKNASKLEKIDNSYFNQLGGIIYQSDIIPKTS